jgi:hypothetical protein
MAYFFIIKNLASNGYFDGAKPDPLGQREERCSVSTLSKPRALDRGKPKG